MKTLRTPSNPGFTLVEVLVVIAIIGIMSSLVITVYRNVAQDSRDVVARQQQAAIQNALNNWITSESTTRSIATIRAEYTGTTSGNWGKLTRLQSYLDEGTFKHFQDVTIDDSKILSAALKTLGKHIEFSTWAPNSYPQVQMVVTQ